MAVLCFMLPKGKSLAELKEAIRRADIAVPLFRDYGDNIVTINLAEPSFKLASWIQAPNKAAGANHFVYEKEDPFGEAQYDLAPLLKEALKGGKTLVCEVSTEKEDDWVQKAKYHAAHLGL